MGDESDLTAGHPSTHLHRREAPAPEPRQPGVPISATFPEDVPDGDTVVYGPDLPDERSLRLLGTVTDKRILELGVGSGRNAVALARQGARVVAVDPDPGRLDRARALAEQHEVKVELHEGDLADIAFLRADAIDLVLGVYALAAEADADRVFRQAHRVLRTECPMILAVPHPAFAVIDPSSADPMRLAHRWFDRTPREWQHDGRHGVEHPRTFGDLIGGLYRAGFRTDTVLEPEPDSTFRSPWWSEAMRWLPSTLIIRARKQGI
jgi:SAM-dependent methyltransferase